jgi:hypothetical protein
LSPPDERRGGQPAMRPVHAHVEAPEAIRQTRTIDVAGARATPVERIPKVE